MKDDLRMDEQDERAEWEAPTITEWDVVGETLSGFTGSGLDGSDYS